HRRVQAVLLAQDARSKRVGGVIRQHRHRGLGDDRAGIEVGRDKMYRAAADAGAGIDRLLLHAQAREGRQQRGMDVDDAVLPVRRKPRALDAQEAPQRHQSDTTLLQLGRDGAIEALAVGKALVRDNRRRNACVLRKLQSRRPGNVAHNDGDFGWIVRSLRRLDQGGHVAPAPGDEDSDLQLRHRLSAWSTTQSASLCGAASILPTRHTLSPASVSTLATVVASPAAVTTIMPSPQLKVRSMSSVGTWPTSRSQRNMAGGAPYRTSGG